MKRRREQQVQRLNQLGEGGTLKIYGPSLDPRIAYVTVLVSARDSAERVVRDAVDK